MTKKTKKKDKYSFETYWAPERERMREGNFPKWLIKTIESSAEKAWNHSKAMANEEILEVNVVINRGIWESLQTKTENSETE